MPQVDRKEIKRLEELGIVEEIPLEISSRGMKPKKSNRGGSMDKCQSPEDVILPLLDFIPKTFIIWESACGEGNLVRGFKRAGYTCIGTDIEEDFYLYEPERWNILVTNPPYGNKPKWTRRSYELGKPFALLMPNEFEGTQRLHTLWKQYGMTQDILFTDPARINFKMPNKGWKGQAQFPVKWFCWNMNLPRDRMVWDYINKEWYL